MIENWNQASEEEERFVRKEARWLLLFSLVACLCILPVGILGIWQAYDIYAIYAQGGISLGFIIIGLLCGVVALLAVLVLWGCWKHYRDFADVFKEQSKKKLDAFWLVMDGAVLAVMLLAWVFLFLDFGAASLYIRLGIHISLIVVAAVTLLYGIIERKAGAIVAAVLLCCFMLITGVPRSLKNIRLDMREGPRECSASITTYERESITRTRRGRRRIRHYYLNISSVETDIREVEVTRAARSYYQKQNGSRAVSGKMIYYPHTKIFLYWLGESEDEK